MPNIAYCGIFISKNPPKNLKKKDRTIFHIIVISLNLVILLQVLGAHIVKGVDVSFADLTDGKTLKTINNFTLTVRKFNNGEKPSKFRQLLIFLISVHTLILP